MKATALIAEDEALLAAHLRAELATCWPELQILPTCSDGDEALSRALQHRPDLLFLDIQMPGKSGLELTQALVEEWPDGTPFPLLVFVTAHNQYAIEAFERAAVDYLLKPVRPERLGLCCQRLRSALALREPARAPSPLQATIDQLRELLAAGIPSPPPGGSGPPLAVIQAGLGSTIEMVPIGEVLYFEAADKYVRVITAAREHLIRTSLRELLPRLDPSLFWQIHRSVVVRADAIAAAQRDETGKLTLHLRDHPDRLPVSRLYVQRFKAM
jgi:DNA-binding LytR/AlgR family response regulator